MPRTCHTTFEAVPTQSHRNARLLVCHTRLDLVSTQAHHNAAPWLVTPDLIWCLRWLYTTPAQIKCTPSPEPDPLVKPEGDACRERVTPHVIWCPPKRTTTQPPGLSHQT
jgi:hypothetical protein